MARGSTLNSNCCFLKEAKEHTLEDVCSILYCGQSGVSEYLVNTHTDTEHQHVWHLHSTSVGCICCYILGQTYWDILQQAQSGGSVVTHSCQQIRELRKKSQTRLRAHTHARTRFFSFLSHMHLSECYFSWFDLCLFSQTTTQLKIHKNYPQVWRQSKLPFILTPHQCSNRRCLAEGQQREV